MGKRYENKETNLARLNNYGILTGTEQVRFEERVKERGAVRRDLGGSTEKKVSNRRRKEMMTTQEAEIEALQFKASLGKN